jgi:hypothetical protein
MGPKIIKRRRASLRWATAGALAILFTAGCNRMEDTTQNFTTAINKYYKTHPSCVWPEAMKFPVQQNASNTKEIKRYDALVYQGLLARTTTQKVMVTAGEPVESYDLTPQGRAAWIADAQQHGYGNLCYGHRTVTSIDSSSPTSSQNGATTDVIYRYTISGVPAWAKAADTQTTFPGLGADLSGNQVGHATLNDSRTGWQVVSAPWTHIPDSDIYK